MISSIVQSLFPSIWLNHVLGRYNAKLLDRHFGNDKKHHRIAHSLNFAKAIKAMVESHNTRAKAVKFTPLQTQGASENEKILLSHALIGNRLITHGTEDEQLKGYRLLNITMGLINKKVEENLSDGLLLPGIIRLINDSLSAFSNTSLGQAIAAENR